MAVFLVSEQPSQSGAPSPLRKFDCFMAENKLLDKTFFKRITLVLQHLYVLVSVSYFCNPFSILLKFLSEETV